MTERQIPTPSNLAEVRRYIDKDAGEITEYVPRNPANPVEYYGVANVGFQGGVQRLTFKLKGGTIEEAIASWAPILSAVIDDLEAQNLRRHLMGNA